MHDLKGWYRLAKKIFHGEAELNGLSSGREFRFCLEFGMNGRGERDFRLDGNIQELIRNRRTTDRVFHGGARSDPGLGSIVDVEDNLLLGSVGMPQREFNCAHHGGWRVLASRIHEVDLKMAFRLLQYRLNVERAASENYTTMLGSWIRPAIVC